MIHTAEGSEIAQTSSANTGNLYGAHRYVMLDTSLAAKRRKEAQKEESR